MNLRVFHIGNLARADNALYATSAHGRIYNALAARTSLVLFGKTIDETEEGFDVLQGVRLDPSIRFDLGRGNTPSSSLLRFVANNILDLARTIRFCRARAHYFVFLPSFAGALAVLLLSVSRRPLSVGLYVGGHFGAEQRYDRRKGIGKNVLKTIGGRIVDALVARGTRTADYVITSSYKVFHEAGDRKRVVMTPPAILVAEEDLAAPAARSEGTHRDVVYCGELRHAKGVFDLLDAFALLVAERPAAPYRLVYIGSGYAGSELKRCAAAKGLGDRVVFAGQIHDADRLKAALRTGWAFVLPSYSEGFPRAAYESFALGVPAILTPVGGIPYLVEDGKHVLFAAPGNPEDIKNKILRLAADGALRKRLVANARDLMRSVIFPRIRKYGSVDQLILRMIDDCRGAGGDAADADEG